MKPTNKYEPLALNADLSAINAGLLNAATSAIDIAKRERKPALLSFTTPFEGTDPLAVLELLGKKDEFQYYWEHPDQGLAVAAGNKLHHIKASGTDRFRRISKKITSWQTRTVEFAEFDHSLNGVFYMGGFSFFDQKARTRWQVFDAASFVIPEWIFIRDGKLCLLTLVTEIKANDDAEGVCNRQLDKLEKLRICIQTGTKGDVFVDGQQDPLEYRIVEQPNEYRRWKEGINNARQLIRNREFEKIVLARALNIEATRDIAPTRLVNQLRKEYPSCFSFLVQINDSSAFIGSSPERLFTYRPSLILTEALAGSISRGKTATEDAILEKKLLNSVKDLEEHNYVVSAIREKLFDYSKELDMPEKPGIKKFPNVQHLYTPVSAWFNNRIDPFELVELMHPTPAVGGYPSLNSIRYIQQFERFERGWYAGPVGWYNNRNRGEFLVGIRSGLIHKDKATFYAGCGIVADSNPDLEWDETKLKFIPMLSALKHG
ncbi:MAG: isochorismate synthase MenF [Cyclonatronaceae bacterium]